MLGSVTVGEVHEHRVPRRPLNERADRGGLALAEDQIALPTAGHSAIISLGRTLADVDHVRDPVAAFAGLAAGTTERPPGPQALRQIAPQSPTGLDVQRLIDRLGRHPHLRIVRELAAQAADDLLRRLAPTEIFLHLWAQRRVRHQLRRLRSARAVIRERVCRRRPITTSPISITGELATDRQWAASQPAGDRAHRLTASARDRDLLPLGERQTAALQITTPTRTHPARGHDPPPPLNPIRPDRLRGPTDELAALQRGQKTAHPQKPCDY